MAGITDFGGDSMEIRYDLKEGARLSEEQIKEIESARNCPYTPDEDSPEIDPEKNPELYEGFLKSLGERNRKLARQVL
jgi:hypothetical protein